MALSPETQAIIDRLKAEGQLVRNTGSNSIKAVRLDLSKFQDVFRTMNDNIQLLGTNINNEELVEQIKRQNMLAELSDDERKKIATDAAERERRENELLNRDMSVREKDMAEREKERKSRGSLFGKNGLFSNIFSGSFNLIKSALFIGLSGSILYELTAGFLERFGVDLPTIQEGFGKLSELSSNVNWESLKNNLNMLASTEFASLLTAGALGYAATKAIPTAVDAVQTLSIIKILENMMKPSADDVQKAGRTAAAGRMGLAAIRLSIAGLIFTGITSVMPAFEDLIRKSMGMTEDEIANRGVDGIDIAGNAGIGLAAALALKGGPPGWIAGLTIFALKTVYDLVENAQNKDSLTNVIKDVENARIESQSKLEELLSLRAFALKYGGNVEAIDAEIEALKQKNREMGSKIFEDLKENSERVVKYQEQLSNLSLADIPTEVWDKPTQWGPGPKRTLSESERTAMLRDREERITDNLEVAQTQLKSGITTAEQFAKENNLTLYQLGLAPTADGSLTTEAMINYASEQAKQQERNQEIIQNQRLAIAEYNQQMTEFERLSRGEVTNMQDLLRRTAGSTNTNPIVLNMPTFNNPTSVVNAPSSSALSSTNVTTNGNWTDHGSYCSFPGAVN
jgi:hypothetical protein